MKAPSTLRLSIVAAALATASAAAFANTPSESSTTTYVPVESTTRYYYVPSTEQAREQAAVRDESITVYGDEDTAIKEEVMDRLAANDSLSGLIGVESDRRDVTLTGRVTTRADVEEAAREARGVDGVSDVYNRLRARVGG